jgi:hypothetical protein
VKSRERLKKCLIWSRRFVLVLVLFSLFVSFLVASIFWMMSGVEPVEGDTYSTPETNVVATFIILGTIIFAWIRSRRKKKLQTSDGAN